MASAEHDEIVKRGAKAGSARSFVAAENETAGELLPWMPVDLVVT
jgi:hypothetical protein